tara:strand:- start:106 stop:240 length:135 start_codon:yes stop_codon:yes gene_type:complete
MRELNYPTILNDNKKKVKSEDYTIALRKQWHRYLPLSENPNRIK